MCLVVSSGFILVLVVICLVVSEVCNNTVMLYQVVNETCNNTVVFCLVVTEVCYGTVVLCLVVTYHDVCFIVCQQHGRHATYGI